MSWTTYSVKHVLEFNLKSTFTVHCAGPGNPRDLRGAGEGLKGLYNIQNLAFCSHPLLMLHIVPLKIFSSIFNKTLWVRCLILLKRKCITLPSYYYWNHKNASFSLFGVNLILTHLYYTIHFKKNIYLFDNGVIFLSFTFMHCIATHSWEMYAVLGSVRSANSSYTILWPWRHIIDVKKKMSPLKNIYIYSVVLQKMCPHV